MARTMAIGQEWFRAVITKTYPDRRVERYCVGPYKHAAQARAAVTRAENGTEHPFRRPHGDAPTVVGRVERSSTVWATVEN